MVIHSQILISVKLLAPRLIIILVRNILFFATDKGSFKISQKVLGLLKLLSDEHRNSLKDYNDIRLKTPPPLRVGGEEGLIGILWYMPLFLSMYCKEIKYLIREILTPTS